MSIASGIATPQSGRSRGMRSAVLPIGALFVSLICLAVFILPMRTWTSQRSALVEKTKQFEAFGDINDALQDENDTLRTPAGAQDAIRSQLGYLLPTEKRVPLLDLPSASADLPDIWPYTIVTNILQVRFAQTELTKDLEILDPLQP